MRVTRRRFSFIPRGAPFQSGVLPNWKAAQLPKTFPPSQRRQTWWGKGSMYHGQSNPIHGGEGSLPLIHRTVQREREREN